MHAGQYYVALLRRRRDGVDENEHEESANGQGQPGDSQDDRGYEALAIDDMRNGILLNSNAHRALSKSLGFLRVRTLSLIPHRSRVELVGATDPQLCYGHYRHRPYSQPPQRAKGFRPNAQIR